MARTVPVAVQAAVADPLVLDLPWHLPLDEWPEDVLVAYPRGISRHVVRFARVGEKVVAVKETSAWSAQREHRLLVELRALGVPAVQPHSVVSSRHTLDGKELPDALVTQHLEFSLPYRTLFGEAPDRRTGERLVDALALLLVHLHLQGFYWGDVSLSNTLFRRDAGAFVAYLVDAETGELHSQLSPGQRSYDIELASMNVSGEMMDLLAMLAEQGHTSSESSLLDPWMIGQRLSDSYHSLWNELTREESFPYEDRWRITERVRRLNALGFDVEETSLRTDEEGQVVLRPLVVAPGHHRRRLLHLTGLETHENQARRLLTDIAHFGQELYPGLDEETAAVLWMREVFSPTLRAIPPGLRHKLEPAELMHQVLEHRWYLSERAERDVPTPQAVEDYVRQHLSQRRDEQALY